MNDLVVNSLPKLTSDAAENIAPQPLSESLEQMLVDLENDSESDSEESYITRTLRVEDIQEVDGQMVMVYNSQTEDVVFNSTPSFTVVHKNIYMVYSVSISPSLLVFMKDFSTKGSIQAQWN